MSDTVVVVALSVVGTVVGAAVVVVTRVVLAAEAVELSTLLGAAEGPDEAHAAPTERSATAIDALANPCRPVIARRLCATYIATSTIGLRGASGSGAKVLSPRAEARPEGRRTSTNWTSPCSRTAA